MIHPDAFIHPKAEIVEGVSIGARTRVWQFASIIRGAIIGDDCNIASGACVDGSRIGDGCIICHNLAMGPGFLIGRRVFIGPNVTFCNDAWPRASKDGFRPQAFDGENWAVIVHDGASIGAGAVILPGVTIRAGAMVAAGSVVSRDVPSRHLWRSKDDVRPITGRHARMRFAGAARAVAP